jgi:O-acetyl-ADP-ribose deacetylase (regulator of RNase III)
MLVYLRNSIFDSPAQTLVNTVNLEGVMGKGIAAEFKARYPSMFKEYRHLCQSGKLKIGDLHLWRGPDKWVLNFPTKTTWRKPSEMSYIEEGLKKFVLSCSDMGVTSISFPPLGCGNGQLDWSDVKPVMESYLKRLPIHVYVHDRQVPVNF